MGCGEYRKKEVCARTPFRGNIEERWGERRGEVGREVRRCGERGEEYQGVVSKARRAASELW